MIEIVQDAASFAALADGWTELLRSSASDGPFLTPEWLQPWWTHAGGSRTLHVVTVRDRGELIALAPLMRTPGPFGIFRRLEFLGTGQAGSDYLDVIVRGSREREGLDALATAFTRQRVVLRL